MYPTLRRILPLTLVLVASFFSSQAFAQWTGKAELGALFTDGNTKSDSANTKLDLTHEAEKWKQNIYFAALYGENGNFATAERYEALYKADRKISDRLSWFVAVHGEEDRFSGFAYQATASTGATYKFIDSASTKFDGSLGAGYKFFQPQQLTISPAGEVTHREKLASDSEPVATVGSNFEHAFTETTKLTNKFLSEIGSSNTTLADDLALQVSMSQTLALAVGLGVRYNSDPPPPSKTTDTQLTVNLVYNIK